MILDDGRAIRTQREYALQVHCPKCRMPPQKLCEGSQGPREACHDARHVRAVALGAPRNVSWLVQAMTRDLG